MLIVGMFVSFTAAMLFFTETVKTPEELEQMILGEVDNTRLSDDFTDPEDKLGVLIKEAASYRQQYETQLRDAEDFRDSLNTEVARLQTDKAAFDLAQQVRPRRRGQRQAGATEEGPRCAGHLLQQDKGACGGRNLPVGSAGRHDGGDDHAQVATAAHGQDPGELDA